MKYTTRNGPVVWSDDKSKNWIAYTDAGVIQLRNAFKPNMIEHIKNLSNGMYNDPTRYKGTVYENDDTTVRSIFDFHNNGNASVLESFLTKFVLAQIKIILGGSFYVHQSHVNYKTPNIEDHDYGWHSDFAYWFNEDGMPLPRAVSLVVPLVPLTEENGTLELLTGSHKHQFSDNWERQEKNPLKAVRHNNSDESENGIIPDDTISDMMRNDPNMEMEKYFGNVGDALIMDANMIHRSGINNSEEKRNLLFITFNSVYNKLIEPNQGFRPEYITNRNIDTWRFE